MEAFDLSCPISGQPCEGEAKVAELLDKIAALRFELGFNELLGDPDRPTAHQPLLEKWKRRAEAITTALASTACDGSSCQPYQAAALQDQFDSSPNSGMRPPLE